MQKYHILFFITILLFMSCSLGLDDGSDIIGTWEPQDGFGGGTLIVLNNNKGYYKYTDKNSNFEWKVYKGSFYNIMERQIIDNSNDKSIYKSEYYFSGDKIYLYMRDYKTDNSAAWYKYKKQ